MPLSRCSIAFLTLAGLCVSLRAQTNVFPASGSVGIGTTSPGATLEISKSGPTVSVTDTGTSYAQFAVRNSSSTFYFGQENASGGSMLGGSASLAGIINMANANPLQLGTSNAVRMTITSGGSVGIGTTSPINLLHVYKDYNASSELILQNPNTGTNAYTGEEILADKAAVTLRAYGSSFSTFTHGGVSLTQSAELWADTYTGTGPQAFLIGIGTNKPLIFSTNNTEALRITGSGNVGIGTTSPSRKLDVNGDLNVGTNLVVNTAVYYGTSYSLGTSGYSFRNSTGSDLMKITDAGNVGIGTTNPAQKLSVNGTIQAKEVIVQTGWSDYVFKPDYRLASLSEVEEAIQKDGHLPGLPSALEVAEHGVNVGEMQSKLLAKVEELTLHLIAQQKELETQRQELSALRQQTQKIISRSQP